LLFWFSFSWWHFGLLCVFDLPATSRANDRTERQPPGRDNARDLREPKRPAEARDSRTAKRGGC